MRRAIRNGVAATTSVVLLVFAQSAGASAWVIFEWEPIAGARAYELQIAADSDLEQTIVDQRVGAPIFRWKAPDAARYYWRVRAMDAAGRPGAWSKIKRHQNAPPEAPARLQLVAPKNGGKLRLLSAQDRVRLAFNAGAVSGPYLVQVSKTKTFADKLLEIRTEIESVTIALPGLGVFYWRARPANGGAGGVSESRKFTVVAGPPRLLAPDPGAVVRVGTHAAQLLWSDNGPAAAWQLEISAGRRVHVKRETREPSFNFSPPTAGDFSWRVRAKDGSGRPGAWSARRAFRAVQDIKLREPQHDAAIVGAEMPAIVAMSWDPIQQVEFYDVELAADEAFTMPVGRAKCTEPNCSMPVPQPGSYWWRVTARGRDAKALSSAAASRFSLTAAASLPVATPPAPTLVAPASMTDFAMDPSSEAPLLSWGPVGGAEHYEVSVMRAGGEDTEATEQTPSTELPFPVSEPGEYAWRVRALAEGVAGPWSASSTLRLNSQLPPDDAESEERVWELGAQVGVLGDGALWTVMARLELSRILSILDHQLVASVRVGYHQHQSVYRGGTGMPIELLQSGRWVPITAALAYRWQLGDFGVTAGAGATAQVVHVAVGALEQWTFRLGGEAYAQVSYPIGPGAIAADLAGTITGIDNSLLDLPLATLALSGGYRLAW